MVTATGSLSLTLSALSSTSSVGLLSTDDHSVGLSGLSATSAVGSLTSLPETQTTLSGLSITSSIGEIEISGNSVQHAEVAGK